MKTGFLVHKFEAPYHVFPLRVYYEDTDAGGIVYYANYLRFAERARTECLRDLGADHRTLERVDSVQLVVRQCDVNYLQPAILDDYLEIHSRFLQVGGASIKMEQLVRRAEVDLVSLIIRLACVGPDGKPKRMPIKLRGAIV